MDTQHPPTNVKLGPWSMYQIWGGRMVGFSEESMPNPVSLLGDTLVC